MSNEENPNRNKIALRPAAAEDAKFLETVYADTRRDELSMFGWSREQEDAFFKMQFDLQTRSYQMQFPKSDNYVIEIDETPVGRLILNRMDDAIHLIDIAVSTRFRNRGIGAKIIQDLKNEAANAGKVLTLVVLKSNEAAHRFYERFGLKNAEESDLHLTMKYEGNEKRITDIG